MEDERARRPDRGQVHVGAANVLLVAVQRSPA